MIEALLRNLLIALCLTLVLQAGFDIIEMRLNSGPRRL